MAPGSRPRAVAAWLRGCPGPATKHASGPGRAEDFRSRSLCRKEGLNPSSAHKLLDMFAEYIAAALERAKYEIIDDPEPYYASVPGLPGVWATGKTIEECRRELISTIEGWIVLGLRMGHPIPPIDGHTIFVSLEPVAVVE